MADGFSLHTYADHYKSDKAALLALAMGPGRYARAAERLREGNQAISDLAYVAVKAGGKLCGSIDYWPIKIGEEKALLLGPLGVHPDMQSKGIGRALMRHTLAKTPLPILLVGDLPYYAPLGFVVAGPGVFLSHPVNPQRILLYNGHDNMQGAVRKADEV